MAVDQIIDQLPLDNGDQIKADGVRVGVQTFNDQQQVLRHLNAFTTDIGNLTLANTTGGTDIDAALQ